MKNGSIFMNLTHLITEDTKCRFTLSSYACVVIIFLNLDMVRSPFLGVLASVFFLLINSTFMGQAFFQKETLFTRFLLGTLILIVTLGLTAWAVLILYNLDNIRTATALLVATTLASILNQRLKTENVAK